MILRSWQGRPKPGKEAEYLAFLENVIFPEIRALPGNRSAKALRAVGEEGAILVLTGWDDLDAVTAFAGEDPSVAVVPPEAQSLLADYDPDVQHFEVVLEAK